ncbi:CAP domain-containing protein [Legionella bononiensis]|uniref:CAP domain-containing protein n=1 Tax=Legionella bononiensis TaxID=2793102 RepID=A0ABS1W8C0_9GAMM|nr:CAP domain-containing protein [Legionella bononiensis]MBL7479894.1 CAP domain-containing protein [Legionella bononiensis]MBL7525591.1 CAP domain-containing protein [Legionella bononiensis]MBL7561775.1 CAP domain-containing protein [Legionella bononiensis]
MYLNKTKITVILTSIILNLFQLAFAGKSIEKASNDTAIQNAILYYINEYRHQHGLSPLKMDNRIVKEAKQHSLDMANHKMPFGHKYFKSRIDRLHSQIKDSNAGAENVAFNYKDAQDVVKNWLRSPGHKQNIDGNYNLTGIGIARDKNGKIYFTQIFLKTGTNSKYAARKPFTHLFNNSLFKRTA